ncbi:MAG: hypothetical protein IK004_04610 [Bacteroidales bacterium]|nr:hypothetical protein [Bacteroidales bacterium]
MSTVYMVQSLSAIVTYVIAEPFCFNVQFVELRFNCVWSPDHAPALNVKVNFSPPDTVILGVSALPFFLLVPNFAEPLAPYALETVQVLSGVKVPLAAVPDHPIVPVQFLKVSVNTAALSCPHNLVGCEIIVSSMSAAIKIVNLFFILFCLVFIINSCFDFSKTTPQKMKQP